jgi:hypothetical protein
MTKYDQTIDEVSTILQDTIGIVTSVYPAFAIAAPFLKGFIKTEAHKLKNGLADGTMVPDGEGGFVPNTNSKYDPKTGKFI